AGRARRRGAGGRSGTRGREARAGRRGRRARELSTGALGRYTGGHTHAARTGKDQCAGEGGRAVAGPAQTAMRTMRRVLLIGLAAAAGCHHGPRIQPAPDPVAELARARAQFHRGDFGKALISFRRLSYELSPTDPEVAEVKYNLAECSFQTGDRVQAAHDFRQVADQFPATPYAPLALLRAGDANL